MFRVLSTPVVTGGAYFLQVKVRNISEIPLSLENESLDPSESYTVDGNPNKVCLCQIQLLAKIEMSLLEARLVQCRAIRLEYPNSCPV